MILRNCLFKIYYLHKIYAILYVTNKIHFSKNLITKKF
jgi:hypothetical protein